MSGNARNHGNRFFGSVGKAPAEIARRARAWLRRQQEAQHLRMADPLERRRTADDLALDPLDLDRAVAADRDDELLLGEMMERFGVDAAALPPRTRGVKRDMERVCANCLSKRRCARALAAGSAASDCRAFCPNALTLDSLAHEERAPVTAPRVA